MKSKKGFTLIEIMVAVSIFIVVITMGMGALATIQQGQKRAVSTNHAMYSMHYVFDVVTRGLRTGTSYKTPTIARSCVDGTRTGNLVTTGDAITYVDQDNRQITYYLVRDGSVGELRAMVDGRNDTVLTDRNSINVLSICFTVGGNNLRDDIQPFVRILMTGEALYKQKKELFTIQTTISQRILDKDY